mgnify:CR=1 FL=1
MACKYIRAFRVERLKLSLDAAAKSHGKPLPRDILLLVAGEHGVQEGWARRIERREDIDLDAYRRHRRQMTKIGVDPDESAGKRVAVGGKATRRNKKAEIRSCLMALLDAGADIDLQELGERFGLPERSVWPRIILSELEKERAAGEKRPVSAAQRDLVFDLLRQIGGDFGEPGEVTEHQKAVDLLLSRYSLAQIHKALKNLHHVVRMVRAMRSSFGVKVVKPLLDAIDFRLFRR